jgi:dihydropteroate synthase
MGILNVTPDSFSDGGEFLGADAAVARAWEIQREGADLLDVGAESTRPGAEEVTEVEEQRRLWPVLTRLAAERYPLPVSIDTRRPSVAEGALRERKVQIVNDVGGLRNPEMAEVVKRHAVPVVLMHMSGSPRTMQSDYHYDDVVTDLISFFRKRLSDTGLKENVVIDPGLGFGKSTEHNLTLLKRLDEFQVLGLPILVGASRKTFIGRVLDIPPGERLEGSLACAVLAAANGAAIVRVHDVRPTVRALRMAEAVSTVELDAPMSRF